MFDNFQSTRENSPAKPKGWVDIALQTRNENLEYRLCRISQISELTSSLHFSLNSGRKWLTTWKLHLRRQVKPTFHAVSQSATKQ
jgi:hypothetical protein